METKAPKSKIAEREEEILRSWEEKEIFKKSIEKEAPAGDYVFYDGPPFATGMPHYGHLVAGTIKDAIPRYRTMKGMSVRRQWGWDCHGLPIENLIEKELGLKNKRDIEKYGVEKFNDAARSSVLRYDAEWKQIVPRMGRFVDMDVSYRTMDWTYSESIWWAFKTLYDKGLAYEGYKSMHICPRCETTLANSEVALGYKDVKDISATVKFELVDEPKTYLLAWTTTPWTLPGNVALAIGKDLQYSRVKIEKGECAGETYIMARERTADTLRRSGVLGSAVDPANYEGTDVIAEIMNFEGKELIGKRYKPVFPYYAEMPDLENKENGWKVYDAPFVTTGEGTGIVHIAPAFGEDDMNLGKEKDLPFVQHVSMDGAFKPEVKDFAGLQVKPKDTPNSTDIEVIKYLAAHGTLFAKEKVEHSYPHCWRCDTPLLNYAASSWFVKVTGLKDDLLKANAEVRWVPESVRDGRFGKWLEGARDWAVSRSRYWGAPLPVWRCDECEDVCVVGSLAEMRAHMRSSGNTYVVMRHGDSDSNAGNFVSSKPGNGHHVTEKGRKEIAGTVAELKKEGAGFDHIYTSDFARTKETAELVAEAFGIPADRIHTDERLREINTGIFDGKDVKEYHGHFSSLAEKFEKRPPEGENLTDVKRRMMELMYELDRKHEGERILIVSHDYPVWMLFSGAAGADVHAAVRMKEERGDDFLRTGETRTLDFFPFPHDNDYEIDVHRPYIDEVKLVCGCGCEMTRIQDVFDCWFESGSMPYSQFHYPFENEKLFKRNFPADFIAEGLDQTRGWFYTLLVLSVGLFGKAAFKNVIGNGLVLAEDGQKMSKRLKNYPDPLYIVNKYGADALRYYLLSSPVVHGEELRFSEKGVDEVFKKVVLRLQNVYSFYELYAGSGCDADAYKKSTNPLDTWVRARLKETIDRVEAAMEAYELDNAVKPIASFIDDLSTWYLRRSRERFKGEDEKDKGYALSTTRYVLEELSKVMAPFTPFIAEDMYGKVAVQARESVHLNGWPKLEGPTDGTLDHMKKARAIVEAALALRAKAGVKVRQPLSKLAYSTKTGEGLPREYENIIADEVNVKNIIPAARENFEAKDEFYFDVYEVLDAGEVGVMLFTQVTDDLKREGMLRDLVRQIQEMRKQEGLTPHDAVILSVQTDAAGREFVSGLKEQLKKATHSTDIVFTDAKPYAAYEAKVEGLTFSVGLSK